MRLPVIIDSDREPPVDALNDAMEANRRAFDQYLGVEIDPEARTVEPFSVEALIAVRAAVRGQGNNPNSRAALTGSKPKGTQHLIKGAVKEAIGEIVRGNLENVHLWIARGAVRKPLVAAKLVIELAEFVLPKLARTEHVGEGGGPVVIQAAPQDRNL